MLYDKLFDRIVNLNIWKWVYYCGISLAGIIFLSNLYNIMVALLSDLKFIDNGYRYIYRGFLSFYTSKGGVLGLLEGILVFSIPSFFSIFVEKKYFYKITFVFLTTFLLALLLLVIFLIKLWVLTHN